MNCFLTTSMLVNHLVEHEGKCSFNHAHNFINKWYETIDYKILLSWSTHNKMLSDCYVYLSFNMIWNIIITFYVLFQEYSSCMLVNGSKLMLLCYIMYIDKQIVSSNLSHMVFYFWPYPSCKKINIFHLFRNPYLFTRPTTIGVLLTVEIFSNLDHAEEKENAFIRK
jgi:hypothetical protein